MSHDCHSVALHSVVDMKCRNRQSDQAVYQPFNDALPESNNRNRVIEVAV